MNPTFLFIPPPRRFADTLWWMALQIKTLLEVLVTKIAASPSKFCVGESITIADLQVRYVVVLVRVSSS